MNSAILPVYASENTFSNLKDVQAYIYNNFKERDSQIQFIYTGSDENYKDNIIQSIKQAYSQDDYTERSWDKITPHVYKSSEGINTTIDVSYLTTKDEEIYVDSQTKNQVDQLIKPGMTEYDKVKAINDYLISKYDYDYSLKSNNAYSALTTGKAICQGYSMTAYKMLSYANIENRIIVGTKDGERHSWNYVKIGNNWSYLDITNNDSTRSYKYFLVGDSILENNKYLWNKLDYSMTTIK
jgi:transglutaminase-like putative cysteine protease